MISDITNSPNMAVTEQPEQAISCAVREGNGKCRGIYQSNAALAGVPPWTVIAATGASRIGRQPALNLIGGATGASVEADGQRGFYRLIIPAREPAPPIIPFPAPALSLAPSPRWADDRARATDGATNAPRSVGILKQ